MTTKRPKTPTVAIQNLLEEKRQIERWLRRLDMAGDKTPELVRQRVRTDYSRRLGAILEELQGYRDDLNAALRQQRETRDGLARQEAEAEEGLAEAELRHAVGEYEEAKWTAIRTEILESLERLREQLKTAQDEIRSLEEVLDDIDSSRVEREPEAPPDRMPVASSPQPRVAPPAAPEPPRPVPLVAELEDEEPPIPTPLPRGPAPAKPRAPAQAVDELAFLKSVIQGEREAGAADQAKAGPRTAAEPARSQEGGAAPPPAKNAAKRTVRCADCGTLNLPTEWYCENCGAELTAL